MSSLKYENILFTGFFTTLITMTQKKGSKIGSDEIITNLDTNYLPFTFCMFHSREQIKS